MTYSETKLHPPTPGTPQALPPSHHLQLLPAQSRHQHWTRRGRGPVVPAAGGQQGVWWLMCVAAAAH